MKNRIMKILCMAVALCLLISISAVAADTQDSDLKVRVNGKLVEFPDGQPFIDAHDRTLIPVRFVAEELGAAVEWNSKTQTAEISKNGITVDITIGEAALKVTENGKTETVKMDTAAVLKSGRTYMPIRFVAEALGAVVDYSDVYRTVGIYADKLTADEINMLRSLPYTTSTAASGYEAAKKQKSAEDLEYFYGADRETFDNFANAREHLYACTLCEYLPFKLGKLDKSLNKPTPSEFFQAVVDEAIAETSYQSERVTITFTADTSCIYQEDNVDGNTCAVRGIVKAHIHVRPTELEGVESGMLCRFGFTQFYKDVDMCIPVDVHMNTITNVPISVNTFVPAGTAY